MSNDGQTMLTILNYKSRAVAADVEVYTLWHGAEHRVNELIQEWGDIENWQTTHNPRYVISVNPNLGAEITLRLRELQTDGHES